ncbi:hypothetical protein CC78DRAFT_608714 [Lojkania enalia]|uniref:RRM domain-containing protein n=1 Tax=Lojkania enalia TaxID=147567 RepID=A0A9P4K446_9PLEO|nr:hypothetical protein CC78DRAFT_608714 [Didymosphaeria enalia]
MESSPIPQTTSSPLVGTDPTVYSPDTNRRLHREAVFVNELDPRDGNFVSRYLVIKSHPEGVVGGTELKALENQLKSYATFKYAVPLMTRNMRLRFASLSDACEGQLILSQLGYHVHHTTQEEFAMAKSQDPSSIDDFEGQVKFRIVTTGNPSNHDVNELMEIVRNLCHRFGRIRDLARVNTNQDSTYCFRVEFQSVDDAIRCTKILTKKGVSSRSKNGHFEWMTDRVESWSGKSPRSSPQLPPMDNFGRLEGYVHTGIPASNNVGPRHHADQHNRVHRVCVENGSDVRTTIMLRNIPNKMDWLSLKKILDGCCFGKYDFLYLRIDFQTASNVGYAFVNFTTTDAVLELMKSVDGRVWSGYRSVKAAEISYATIQGKESLIQKFRNSSVMQEAPFCRPRLFWSEVDFQMHPHRIGRYAIGTEQDFPAPDNPAKLQRSVDSARSIGLYPPNGVNHGNDHRNRTSMWDRGTPRDQLEVRSPFGQIISEDMKRTIEDWYYRSTYIYKQFDMIPFGQALHYVEVYRWMMQGVPNPGVIGQVFWPQSFAAPSRNVPRQIAYTSNSQ